MNKVMLIFRKTQPVFFSIERVFELLFPEQRTEPGFSRFQLPFYTSGIKEIVKNIMAVKRLKADVFHITGDAHYVVLGLPSSKSVLTIHDCVFLHQHSGLKRTFLKWLLLDMPVKRATLITTISENTKKEIVENTNCSPGKITVIPNPVDERIYFKEKEFNTIKPGILFIGSTPNKNLERCIEALKGISCTLKIIGKINPGQMELLRNNNIDYNASHGLSDTELANEYANSDIVLFPSTFEGFGLPIIEAQKAGRVTITSNISPMKDVAADGALLIDPYDVESIRNGINLVIKDSALRERFIGQGFSNVQKYSATFIAEQYKLLYKKVINKSHL